MLNRTSVIEADPRKIDDGIAFVRDRVQPFADTQPGSLGLGMWVDRDSGTVVVSTVWEDSAALQASESRANALRAEAATLVGARSVHVEVLEPAIVWQAGPDQPGYAVRSTMMTVSADKVADGVAMVRDELLPQVQQLPGVNTFALLVNRDTGLAVISVTFRTKADRDAARERAAALRAQAVARLGASEPTVLELDTVIVGIRGPEIPAPREGADQPETQP